MPEKFPEHLEQLLLPLGLGCVWHLILELPGARVFLLVIGSTFWCKEENASNVKSILKHTHTHIKKKPTLQLFESCSEVWHIRNSPSWNGLAGRVQVRRSDL